MKNNKIYVHGIVKDYECNLEKYLFSENERLNVIIDELEERIDKAIKYIKSYCAEPDGSIVTYGDDLNPIELLEILEGNNEED